MDKNFVGNAYAYDLIVRNVEQKEPAPMILYGRSGLGKLSAAKSAASAMLGVPIERLKLNLDYYLLDKENEIIKVEDIQALLERSSVSSVSGKKVFIIRNAENMNVQAQNKLLKLLEDRNTTNKLIFTCSRLLIGTIISRCNTISFYPLSIQEMDEYLKKQQVNPKDRHLAAFLCDFCPYNWEKVEPCYGDLRKNYEELLGMDGKEEIFRCLHLLVEKDPKSFYEIHSKHLTTGMQLLQYVFYHIMMMKLGDTLPEPVISELKGLEHIYSLPQAYGASAAIESHKSRAIQKYTKNDFFDLVMKLV